MARKKKPARAPSMRGVNAYRPGQRKRNPFARGTPKAAAWNRAYNRQRSAAGGGGGS